jgi:PHD/YefM family antitoxin component YafN of YafNO toxin-antitoxin module
MEISEIKTKIDSTVKTLPPHKLKIALDLLEDLKRTDEEETQLLLDDIGFMEEYRQAKEDIRTGQTQTIEPRLFKTL